MRVGRLTALALQLCGCAAFHVRPAPLRSAVSPLFSSVEEPPVTRPRVDVNPRAVELFGDPYEPLPVTGTEFLPEEALERAKKGSFVEKMKLKKDGATAWREVHELAALLRSGQYTWEELDLDTIDQRLKYAGLFHRRKRTPGRFMMRMKIPNGIVTADQLRFCAEALAKYGDDEVVTMDITTRQNLQLRGLKLEDTSDLITGLVERGLGCYMSGLDNVRNMVGNPLAGIDPLEDYDTRQLCTDINNMITNNNRGNPEWANMGRKFNIAISGSRDDYAHTHINDIGLQAIEKDGEMGFNIVVGGYFSTKRVATSVELDLWIPPSEAVNLCYSILRLFRDHGERKDRQKARLMWLIESWGVEKFREAVIEEMRTNKAYGGHEPVVARAQHHKTPPPPRRDYLGVHPQKQEGLSWVGLHVPVGRFTPLDAFEAARVAEKYCDGELRLTVEQNIIFPNVKNEQVAEMLQDPFFSGRFKIEPGPLSRGLVSCTGAQFCGIGLIETKNRALKVVERLEAELDIPQTVRMHWSGCPNSCGQSQVADIGLLGAPAKKEGKAVEGADIFLGGAVGEEAELGDRLHKNVAFGNDDEDLIPVLKELLMEKFGAVAKA